MTNRQGDEDQDRLELLTIFNNLKKELDRYLRLASLSADGRHLDAAQALQRTPDLTASLLKSLTAATRIVQNFPLDSNIREAAKHARLHYHETLERYLDQTALQRRGQWPSYVIADILRLQINIERNEALIDGKKAGTLEPTRLVDSIRDRLEELLEESFDTISFLSLLRGAHEQVTAVHGRSVGDYADIRDIYDVIRAQKEGPGSSKYSETKFGADFYRLYSEGRPRTSDGLVLELSPAQNAAGGLYIPARDGGNYIAALRFVGGPSSD